MGFYGMFRLFQGPTVTPPGMPEDQSITMQSNAPVEQKSEREFTQFRILQMSK